MSNAGHGLRENRDGASAAPTPDTAPAVSSRSHWHILVGLVLGAIAGGMARLVWPASTDAQVLNPTDWIIYHLAEPAGQIFLRLIFMVVLPLLFCAMVLGIAATGDIRRLGRMGLLTLALTIILSAASVGIGVGLVDVIRPGHRLAADQRATLAARYAQDTARLAAQKAPPRTLRDTLLSIIPKNPLRELIEVMDGTAPGGMLAVMFFALAFGIALMSIGARAGPVLAVLEGIYDATMVIVRFAMRLAPFGVGGLMFAMTATLGVDVLVMLGWFVGTVVAGLALHMFGVYSLVVLLGARMRPSQFFARISDAIITGFATSSSNATLPTSLRVTQQGLGVRPQIARFVLTVGATANQNGTALYEGVTVLFLAQVFGADLTFGVQLKVAVLCILAGIGTAGVPGGSIPFVALVLQSIGLPPEGIGIILGADRFLDMCRTSLNVTGDIAIAACVDRWQGKSALPA